MFSLLLVGVFFFLMNWSVFRISTLACGILYFFCIQSMCLPLASQCSACVTHAEARWLSMKDLRLCNVVVPVSMYRTKLLCLQEFDVRRHARSEGRRYCDPVVLTYQAERMPEQIRLKVNATNIKLIE